MKQKNITVISSFLALLVVGFLFTSLIHAAGKDRSNRIMPFDKVEILVYPQTEQNRTLEVSDEGTIFFDFLGEINVEGLTEEKLAEKLTKMLADGYFRDPHITVNLLKENSVVIMGDVQNPQSIPLDKGNITFIQAIAASGGFKETADLKMVKIVRPEGDKTKTIHVNAKRIMHGEEKDFLLENGDVIIVPATLQTLKENQIVVMGHVRNPQAIPVEDSGITLIQAIVMAGGFSDLAAVTRVKVVTREAGGSRVRRVNAKKIMNGQENDFLLEPGDVVIVEERLF